MRVCAGVGLTRPDKTPEANDDVFDDDCFLVMVFSCRLKDQKTSMMPGTKSVHNAQIHGIRVFVLYILRREP